MSISFYNFNDEYKISKINILNNFWNQKNKMIGVKLPLKVKKNMFINKFKILLRNKRKLKSPFVV